MAKRLPDGWEIPLPETPLHWAASNDVAVLDALLDAGADIEAPGAVLGGGSPLANACGFGNRRRGRLPLPQFTLTEPEFVQITPQQHWQAVQLLSSMILNHLQQKWYAGPVGEDDDPTNGGHAVPEPREDAGRDPWP